MSAQRRRPGKARRRVEGKKRKDRTGATHWGAHRPVNAISPAVSPSFRAMSLCDNCRIKSTHYCVTAFRGGPARYYGHSACPHNGGPTRRRAVDIVLRKEYDIVLLLRTHRFRINGNKRRGKKKRSRESDNLADFSSSFSKTMNRSRIVIAWFFSFGI